MMTASIVSAQFIPTALVSTKDDYRPLVVLDVEWEALAYSVGRTS
jgi:hypothetical protein